MLSTKSLTFLLLLLQTLLLVFSAFYSFSHGAYTPTSGVIDEDKYELVSWRIRRSVAEEFNNSSLILAEERTHRKDPLDDFKYYKGGWNISQKHYVYVCISTFKPYLHLLIWCWSIICYKLV